jgi:hypothetical protein
MINEKEICFVTTTLYTKWLNYQSLIIKNLFPESKHLIIDGRINWPNSWFYWIEQVKMIECKFFVHIDEDFFIINKNEVIKCLSRLQDENVDLLGVPDGYQHYRAANPIAMNTFILFGRKEILNDIDFNNIKFTFDTNKGWINNYNLVFKEHFRDDFNYQFPIQGGCNFNFQQEPYYAFLWKLKELGYKFDYLYPHFDDRFKSTNPRISENSKDIGIHMWYTRQWNSQMDVLGLPNIKRYELIEDYLNSNIKIIINT